MIYYIVAAKPHAVPTTILDRLGSSDGDLSVVDCNLHVAPRDEDALVERLPEGYRGKGVSYPKGTGRVPSTPPTRTRFRPTARQVRNSA